MIRSFLAIDLSKTLLQRIEEVEKDLKSTHADVRWVSPEKIHLTLKFFGNIEESRIDPILKTIEEPIRNTLPFSINVRGIGTFPHLQNPRVIWMGLTEGREQLLPLQQQIETHLETIGFQPEARSFKPHLTLGRVKSNQGKEALIKKMEQYREETFGHFQVDQVILFKSDLKPGGAVYTILGEVKLGN